MTEQAKASQAMAEATDAVSEDMIEASKRAAWGGAVPGELSAEEPQFVAEVAETAAPAEEPVMRVMDYTQPAGARGGGREIKRAKEQKTRLFSSYIYILYQSPRVINFEYIESAFHQFHVSYHFHAFIRALGNGRGYLSHRLSFLKRSTQRPLSLKYSLSLSLPTKNRSRGERRES